MTVQEIHRQVMQGVEASQEAVWRIARQLNSSSHVTVNSSRLAPNRAAAGAFADSGDLFMKVRLEVKHLSADFTSARDWPFGSKFIVTSKSAHDKAWPVPARYLIVNRQMTHVAVVRVADRERWTVEKRRDKVSGELKDFYFSPLDSVKFCAIEELR
jgi:hypothetical protein